MNSSFRSTRTYRLLVWILIAICILSIYLLVADRGPGMIPYGDSVQYWAAGNLVLRGENPYSAEKVMELRISEGNNLIFPPNSTSMMLYPPWVIPFLLPFGFNNYPLMRLLWFIFHIVILVISANAIWKLYEGKSKKKYVIYLILLTFPPTYFVLVIGHFTTLHLLGLVGFLYFLHKKPVSRWNNFAAGAFASIVLLKPQLMYLYVIALLIWIIKQRNWYLMAGGLSTIGILSLISISINPQIYSQYWETISNYESGPWLTPTIGMGLRSIFGLQYEWLQLVPILLGAGWFLYYWSKKGQNWNWIDDLPLLLLVGFVTVPYGWTYDMVILLIPVIAIIIQVMEIKFDWKVVLFFISFLVVNLATLYLHSFLDDFWFLWYAPFLLVWYLSGKRLQRKSTITVINTMNEHPIPEEYQSS